MIRMHIGVQNLRDWDGIRDALAYMGCKPPPVQMLEPVPKVRLRISGETIITIFLAGSEPYNMAWDGTRCLGPYGDKFAQTVLEQMCADLNKLGESYRAKGKP